MLARSKMTRVTSDEQPEQVSSAQETQESGGGEKSLKPPYISRIEESKYTAADELSVVRGHSASIRVGKPNQTLHTEHTQATGQGVTSQALATAEVRKKSLVREAILKFSVKVKNHPPDLQKVHGDPPKVKLSPEPQKRANPKSTPNLQKVNFDPPKVTYEPANPKSPENRGCKTLKEAKTPTKPTQIRNQEVNLKLNPFFLLKRVGPKTLQSVNMPEPNPQFSSKG